MTEENYRYVIVKEKTESGSPKAIKLDDTKKSNTLYIGLLSFGTYLGLSKKQLIKLRKEINKILLNDKVSIHEHLYLMLQELQDIKPELCGWLSSNGYTNLTVCPRCKVDDFVHVEGCKLIR